MSRTETTTLEVEYDPEQTDPDEILTYVEGQFHHVDYVTVSGGAEGSE